MIFDFIDSLEKRYDNIYSLGTKAERGFYQNVGKVVNKEAFATRPDDIATKAYENIERMFLGEKRK